MLAIHFTKLKEKYGRIAAQHDKFILGLVMVMFVVVSLLSTYFYADRYRAIDMLEPQNSHSFYPVTLTPVDNGELWILDGDLRVFGVFQIDAPSYYDRVYIPGQMSRRFIDGSVAINTSILRSGTTEIELTWGNYSDLIRVIVSHSDLASFKGINHFWMASLMLMVFAVSIPVGYVVVIAPASRHLTMQAFKEEILDLEIEGPDWKSGISRTEKIVTHLAGRTDYYRGMRGSLLNIIGILYGGCLGLVTVLISGNFDPIIAAPIILYSLMTMVVLVRPVQLLFSSTTNRFLPVTSWFFRGRVAAEPPSRESFDYDLRRNLIQIVGEQEKAVFMDNLRQVVSLYYILRNARGHYKGALAVVQFAFVNLIAGIFIVFIKILDLWDLAILILLGGLALFLVLGIVITLGEWFLEDLHIEIVTLFYNPDLIDLASWQEFDRLIEQVDEDSIRLVPTGRFSLETKVSLIDRLNQRAVDSMQEQDLQPYDFSQEPEKFGEEILVLTIARIGEEESFIIYPHYREENGRSVLVQAMDYKS
jgi:hypothetical protein